MPVRVRMEFIFRDYTGCWVVAGWYVGVSSKRDFLLWRLRSE